jgi:hypothetical protein
LSAGLHALKNFINSWSEYGTTGLGGEDISFSMGFGALFVSCEKGADGLHHVVARSIS